MDKGYTISVLGHGFVRYVDHFGDDQRIVETARISYKSPSKGPEQDKKLLHYLYKHRHTSPFEAVNITFNIKMPIFIMRQFVRHRTARLNEWSGRYSEMADEFYIPTVWRRPEPKNKQGSIRFPADWEHGRWTTEVSDLFGQCYSVYRNMLLAGIAKEQARIVLPVALYTEIYVNFDLHNLMHFLSLRRDAHAQQEIREIADAMYEIAKVHYPWAIEAYDRYRTMMIDVSEDE